MNCVEIVKAVNEGNTLTSISNGWGEPIIGWYLVDADTKAKKLHGKSAKAAIVKLMTGCNGIRKCYGKSTLIRNQKSRKYFTVSYEKLKD